MNKLVEYSRQRLKELCPGEAFHAKNQGTAELVANEMMDLVTRLCAHLEAVDQIALPGTGASDILKMIFIVSAKTHEKVSGHNIDAMPLNPLCDECLTLNHLHNVLFGEEDN